MRNPSHFELKLQQLSGRTYIHFTDAYHPQWKLRIGTVAWLPSLIFTDYFLPDNNHFQNDTHGNSFFIDHDYILQNIPAGSYKRNDDGSIDIDVSLYFYPQSFFLLGLVTSAGFLIVSLLFLVYKAIVQLRHA